jgi:hypothetical protein
MHQLGKRVGKCKPIFLKCCKRATCNSTIFMHLLTNFFILELQHNFISFTTFCRWKCTLKKIYIFLYLNTNLLVSLDHTEYLSSKLPQADLHTPLNFVYLLSYGYSYLVWLGLVLSENVYNILVIH